MPATLLFGLDTVVSTSFDVFTSVAHLSADTYVTVLMPCMITPLCLFYDISAVFLGVLVVIMG